MDIFLTSYITRVIDKNTGEILSLGNIQGNRIITIFNDALAGLNRAMVHDEENQKLMKVRQLGIEAQEISGIIETGEYGYESDIYNVQTNTVTYHRSSLDAELLPFYFRAYFPSGADEGILLLQRFGQLGIKVVFSDYMEDYFGRNYPELEIRFNPFMPETLLMDTIDSARVTKLRFIKFEIPTDLADTYVDGHIEETGEIEHQLKVKRRGSFLSAIERIKEVIMRRRDVTSFYELTEFPEYDNVKVEVVINGRPRIIDLLNIGRFRTNYDISQEIEIGRDGHPVFDSIESFSKEFIRDLAQGIDTDAG